MTYTLGIDTSSFELGVGIYCDHRPIASFSRFITNSHAEHLGPCVDFVLKNAGIKPLDINRLGVVVGPGSFTGLRIGIAFVKGFCFERTIAVAALSSLEVAAAAVGLKGQFWVAFDARRDEVFAARFENDHGTLRRLTEDRLMTAATFYEQQTAEGTIVTDSLGYAKSTIFTNSCPGNSRFSLEEHAVQRGLAAARLAAFLDESSPSWASPIDVLPHYLRISAAEEKRLA